MYDNDSDENSENVLDPYADDAQLDSHAITETFLRHTKISTPPRPSTKSPYASGKKNDDKDKKKNKKKRRKREDLFMLMRNSRFPKSITKLKHQRLELIANCYTHTQP